MLRDFTKEQYDIILQAGQSNSEGYGFGEASQPYEPVDEVHYLNSDGSISVAQETVRENWTVGNFALSFCRRYIAGGRLKPGRKLLVVRAALGGTAFLDNRWGMKDDLYLQMLEMTRTALSLNPLNRLAAFLWHQGESDAWLNAGYQVHYNHVYQMVTSVRKLFDCESLPFIAGDMVQQWISENSAICKPVTEAMRDLCREIGNAAFVESEGLESNKQKIGIEDTIHFCRESLYQLGERYFEAYERIAAPII